jgi:type IV secretory pathway VirB10-like protein
MISKTLAVALLAAGCVTAAAGGAYLGVRHNGPAQPAIAAVPAADTTPAVQPVSETEAIVGTAPPTLPALTPAPAIEASDPPPAPRPVAAVARNEGTRNGRSTAPASTNARRREAAAPAPVPAAPVSAPADPVVEPTAPNGAPAAAPDPVSPIDPPSAPPEPRFEELVLPASSVIGLQVETPVSSERARIEDRVDARVTRDVLAAGRVAIPAGSRVLGNVTLVEKGGKVKERARLGVRFHTLVLADGSRIPLQTEAILREGEPPSGESARKIGGAAVGGAILGAIIGGKKGAMIGASTGAGAGTAAVMAGDRNAATLPAGTIVTVRLTGPASIEVARQ